VSKHGSPQECILNAATVESKHGSPQEGNPNAATVESKHGSPQESNLNAATVESKQGLPQEGNLSAAKAVSKLESPWPHHKKANSLQTTLPKTPSTKENADFEFRGSKKYSNVESID
jgi:hypothetical protein